MDLPHSEQLKELSEFIFANFKYDFREYAESSFSRRVVNFLQKNNLHNTKELIQKITLNPDLINTFVCEITVNVTELFRDPSFWKSYSNYLDTYIRSKNEIRILHLACSSGEEMLSNQVIFHKLHSTNKLIIDCYDIDPNIIKEAKKYSFNKKNLHDYQANFSNVYAGDRLESYFNFDGDYFTLNKDLKTICNFKIHDIITEQIFEKYDIIFCRNLLIYFTPRMQSMVIEKLYKALNPKGILCIGAKESLIWYDLYNQHFCAIDQKNKIYQKLTL